MNPNGIMKNMEIMKKEKRKLNKEMLNMEKLRKKK